VLLKAAASPGILLRTAVEPAAQCGAEPAPAAGMKKQMR
jgi:hypothetical protein